MSHYIPHTPLFTLAIGFLSACSTTSPKPSTTGDWQKKSLVSAPRGPAIFPDSLADPFEPVNRGIWEFNKGLLFGVVKPGGRVYRAVVAKPVRRSITDFTRNITYPGRVLNQALQGRWKDAGDETTRFFCNTTVGVGGFYDVATQWNLPKSDANFSQTFGTWGWKQSTFIMLPALGPSDERNAVGMAADAASEPWNYHDPYRYAARLSTVNRLSGISEEAARLVSSEEDSYVFAKYAWTYATKDGKPDWQLKGAIDQASLETIGVAAIRCEDPEFPSRAKEMAVRIPTTGKKLKFNYWLQPTTAPLVYISPGLSSHRLSSATLSVAEHLHRNGFSVVTTTSVFHPEFMENASSVALPVYVPIDSNDLLVALTEMDQALEKKYPTRFGKRALLGCSMGGFLATRLAACENEAEPNLIKFDRYVTINAPVDLQHGAFSVDEFYNAPLSWPADQRQAQINNIIHKGAALRDRPKNERSPFVFDGVETKYVIGLSFKFSLRDIIYSTQSRNNMGVLNVPISPWRREETYREIMKYTFREYFLKFAVPFYAQRGIGINELRRQGNLRLHTAKLSNQSKMRVITNRNDFLLAPSDVAWIRSTFKPSQVKIFPNGGHLGNLASQPVKKALLDALGGLQ